jgi:membrane-associated phospholipid phosphatase
VVLYVIGDALPGWDRRRGATVLAAALLAIALTGLLKTVVALPRPAGAGTSAYAVPGLIGEVYAWAATADGYGVPSGHALGSTAVYGTIAALVDRPLRRRAALAAAALVAVAAVSRLALGVHLLLDVLAGVAVGLLVVLVATRWTARQGRTLGLAVLAAAGWAVRAGGDTEALGAAAVALGALLAWHRYGDRLCRAPGLRDAVSIAGAFLLAGLALVAIEVGGPATAAGAGFVGMAAVVTLPLARE